MENIEQSTLEIKGINKTFGNTKVLNDINISINAGEFVCFLGPSGCGKTTMLRILAGLETADNGSITFEDRELTKLHPGKRGFGMVFQSYALFPNMTAYDNIAYGLKQQKKSPERIEKEVNRALSLVGLSKGKDKYPSEMSGGQQQRVALARAMVLSPKILLLDEPLSALDAKVRAKLRRDIKKIQRLGITTIMVTHDQEEALTMSDKIVVMNNGEVVQIGSPSEIYDSPVNEFVADFIGAVNFIRDDEGTKAIRPEHVLIREEANEDTIEGTLRSWEYRGSFYRLRLKVEEPKCKIDIDVSSNILKNTELVRDMKFFLELDKDYVLEYANG